MIDLHSHMLPGLDDGASDWEESLAMARAAVEDGIAGVVCTPHWIPQVYNNTPEKVLQAVGELKRRLHEQAIHLEVYPGAELRLDPSLLEALEKQHVLALDARRKYALIELPPEVVDEHLERFFWSMATRGITPVLAHPEKHRVVMGNPERIQDWVQRGVLIQITAASLVGRYGRAIQGLCYSLLEAGLVHVIATDAHGMGVRKPVLSEARDVAAVRVGEEQAVALVRDNPKSIVSGERITANYTAPVVHKVSWRRLFSGGRRRVRTCS